MKKIGVVVLPLLTVAVIGCGEARTASHPTSTAPPPVLGLQERLQSRQQELAEHRREGHEQHQREITEAQEQRETAARVQQTKEHSETEEHAHEWSEAAKHNFINACKASGTGESNCQCVLHGMQQRLSEQEVAALEAAALQIGAEAYKNNPKFKEVAEECGAG